MLEGFNFRIIWEYMPFFMEGVRNTALISLISLFLALIAGIIACAGRLSKWKLIRGVAIFYIESIRTTPLLVQIYFFYFGLPTLGFRIPELQTGILALMLNSGAYIAEIVRAGIQSVSKGQSEAAYALGLNESQRLRLVVLPQALRVIIPPLTSQYLNLTKNSSLAVAVGYPDLFAIGRTVINQTGRAVEVIGITMIVYLSISLLTALFMNWYNQRIRLVER